MFQLYRESIEDIFKLVISTLLLKPSQRAKELESFNKDLFITLIGVQGEFSTDIDEISLKTLESCQCLAKVLHKMRGPQIFGDIQNGTEISKCPMLTKFYVKHLEVEIVENAMTPTKLKICADKKKCNDLSI